MKTLYSILNVSANATRDEINQSYRSLAKKYHPDLNPGNKEAIAKFKECTNAYEILSDTSKRSDYDRSIESQLTHHNTNHFKAFKFVHSRPGVDPKVEWEVFCNIEIARRNWYSSIIKARVIRDEFIVKKMDDIKSRWEKLKKENADKPSGWMRYEEEKLYKEFKKAESEYNKVCRDFEDKQFSILQKVEDSELKKLRRPPKYYNKNKVNSTKVKKSKPSFFGAVKRFFKDLL